MKKRKTGGADMNKVNVMGKELQIVEGMTFGELAKEFQGEFSSAILLAKQGNDLKELDYEITHVDTLLKTGNLAADVILSAKIAQAKENGIAVNRIRARYSW